MDPVIASPIQPLKIRHPIACRNQGDGCRATPAVAAHSGVAAFGR